MQKTIEADTPAVGQAAKSRAKSEVVGVQYLRAVAAILVVLHHARDQFPALSQIIPTHALQGGVDIFFVISGFIMVHTTTRPGYTRWEFWERRLTRIVPLYWTATVFTAFLLIFFPSLPRDSKFTIPSFVMSLLFLPHHNPGKVGSLSPMLSLGWTLNYEMFFYLIFGLLIFLRPVTRTATIAVLFATLVCLVAIFQPTLPALKFWGDAIVLEFVFGCAVACLEIYGFASRVPILAAALLLGASAICFLVFGSGDLNGAWRVRNLGLASAGIVLAVVCMDRQGAFARSGPVSRVMKELGDASYSIYLAHLYPVIAFRVAWEKLHFPIQSTGDCLLFFVLCATVGVSSGWLVYRYVELWLKARTRQLIGLTRR